MIVLIYHANLIGCKSENGGIGDGTTSGNCNLDEACYEFGCGN